MPREFVALSIADLSDFARRLRADLARAAGVPGHLRLMNMLARAAGYSNFQHLRAARPSGPAQAAPQAAVDPKRLDKALRHFDAGGRLARWPNRTGMQALCLWVLWARLPARQTLSEPQINRLIDDLHLFGDRAILRRSLIGHGLFERSADGRAYRRIERQPPAEAKAIIGLLMAAVA